MKVHYQSRLEHMENDKQVLNKQIETLKQQISTADNLHSTEKDNLKHKVEQLEKELSANQEKLIKSIEEQKTQRQVRISVANIACNFQLFYQINHQEDLY